MFNEVLNWGLICTANINRLVIPGIRQYRRANLLAVSSRDQERAQDYANAWRIPRAYGTYEDLLADPDVDVVYIGLPNHLHAEWTIRCVEAGKHVLCEKPLGLTEQDVKRMGDAAAAAGVILLEAYMYRFHPQMAKVRELIQENRLGRIRHIHAVFSFWMDYTDDIRWQPEKGGGSLWDVGCYPVSFAREVAGTEPDEVFGWITEAPSGVDEAFAGTLRWRNGLIAQFDAGFRLPQRMAAYVAGEEGTLALRNPWKAGQSHLKVRDDDGKEVIEGPDLDPYYCEVEHLTQCILEGEEPLISIEDSVNNTRALAALYESAEKGQPVLLYRTDSQLLTGPAS